MSAIFCLVNNGKHSYIGSGDFVQMGRTYLGKSERGCWSEESMQQAIIALDEGKPIKTCAVQFNVPRNTLRRHWMKRLKKHPGCRHLSRQSILGPQVEKGAYEDNTSRLDHGWATSASLLRPV